MQAILEEVEMRNQGDAGARDVSEPKVEVAKEEEPAEVTPEMRFFKLVLGSTSKPKLEGLVYTRGLNLEELRDWINDMDKLFDYEEMEEGKRVKFVVTKLKGHVALWWHGVHTERRRLGKQPIKKWNMMVVRLREVKVLSKEEDFKVVEKDLQHLDMELAAAQISIHPQKVMQVAKGVFSEEEEVEVEEEKSDVTYIEKEAAKVQEEENVPEKGEPLVANKVLLKVAKEVVELAQRKTLFRIVCKVQGKCYQMVIDSGNPDNLVSTEVVEKLKLKTKKHPTPYKVSWLQKGHQLLVNE
eukprot:PITA_09524